MPRKLKVGFSNTPANEVHATFRDLGFVAKENGIFSVYCAGGLGPNPKLGVHITDNADPNEVSLYVHAMIRLFTTYGNYESRAKSRTRYLQDTLGEEKNPELFPPVCGRRAKRNDSMACRTSPSDFQIC